MTPGTILIVTLNLLRVTWGQGSGGNTISTTPDPLDSVFGFSLNEPGNQLIDQNTLDQKIDSWTNDLLSGNTNIFREIQSSVVDSPAGQQPGGTNAPRSVETQLPQGLDFLSNRGASPRAGSLEISNLPPLTNFSGDLFGTFLPIDSGTVNAEGQSGASQSNNVLDRNSFQLPTIDQLGINPESFGFPFFNEAPTTTPAPPTTEQASSLVFNKPFSDQTNTAQGDLRPNLPPIPSIEELGAHSNNNNFLNALLPPGVVPNIETTPGTGTGNINNPQNTQPNAESNLGLPPGTGISIFNPNVPPPQPDPRITNEQGVSTTLEPTIAQNGQGLQGQNIDQTKTTGVGQGGIQGSGKLDNSVGMPPTSSSQIDNTLDNSLNSIGTGQSGSQTGGVFDNLLDVPGQGGAAKSTNEIGWGSVFDTPGTQNEPGSLAGGLQGSGSSPLQNNNNENIIGSGKGEAGNGIFDTMAVLDTTTGPNNGGLFNNVLETTGKKGSQNSLVDNMLDVPGQGNSLVNANEQGWGNVFDSTANGKPSTQGGSLQGSGGVQPTGAEGGTQNNNIGVTEEVVTTTGGGLFDTVFETTTQGTNEPFWNSIFASPDTQNSQSGTNQNIAGQSSQNTGQEGSQGSASTPTSGTRPQILFELPADSNLLNNGILDNSLNTSRQVNELLPTVPDTGRNSLSGDNGPSIFDIPSIDQLVDPSFNPGSSSQTFGNNSNSIFDNQISTTQTAVGQNIDRSNVQSNFSFGNSNTNSGTTDFGSTNSLSGSPSQNFEENSFFENLFSTPTSGTGLENSLPPIPDISQLGQNNGPGTETTVPPTPSDPGLQQLWDILNKDGQLPPPRPTGLQNLSNVNAPDPGIFGSPDPPSLPGSGTGILSPDPDQPRRIGDNFSIQVSRSNQQGATSQGQSVTLPTQESASSQTVFSFIDPSSSAVIEANTPDNIFTFMNNPVSTSTPSIIASIDISPETGLNPDPFARNENVNFPLILTDSPPTPPPTTTVPPPTTTTEATTTSHSIFGPIFNIFETTTPIPDSTTINPFLTDFGLNNNEVVPSNPAPTPNNRVIPLPPSTTTPTPTSIGGTSRVSFPSFNNVVNRGNTANNPINTNQFPVNRFASTPTATNSQPSSPTIQRGPNIRNPNALFLTPTWTGQRTQNTQGTFRQNQQNNFPSGFAQNQPNNFQTRPQPGNRFRQLIAQNARQNQINSLQPTQINRFQPPRQNLRFLPNQNARPNIQQNPNPTVRQNNQFQTPTSRTNQFQRQPAQGNTLQNNNLQSQNARRTWFLSLPRQQQALILRRLWQMRAAQQARNNNNNNNNNNNLRNQRPNQQRQFQQNMINSNNIPNSPFQNSAQNRIQFQPPIQRPTSQINTVTPNVPNTQFIPNNFVPIPQPSRAPPPPPPPPQPTPAIRNPRVLLPLLRLMQSRINQRTQNQNLRRQLFLQQLLRLRSLVNSRSPAAGGLATQIPQRIPSPPTQVIVVPATPPVVQILPTRIPTRPAIVPVPRRVLPTRRPFDFATPFQSNRFVDFSLPFEQSIQQMVGPRRGNINRNNAPTTSPPLDLSIPITTVAPSLPPGFSVPRINQLRPTQFMIPRRPMAIPISQAFQRIERMRVMSRDSNPFRENAAMNFPFGTSNPFQQGASSLQPVRNFPSVLQNRQRLIVPLTRPLPTSPPPTVQNRFPQGFVDPRQQQAQRGGSWSWLGQQLRFLRNQGSI